MDTGHTAARPLDEAYWATIREFYTPCPEFINFENGLFSPVAKPVMAEFERINQEVNREMAFYLRRRFPELLQNVREDLARFAGINLDELLITKNATEALNILIQGYPFKDGDEVIFGQHDHDSVVELLGLMCQRKRIIPKLLDPILMEYSNVELVELYERAITKRTKVIILTHMVHTTGQILPVAEISAMARRHSVDVIVDAAHSFAQLNFQLPSLGADFIAVNLHKWLGAPLGTGMLYIRRNRVVDIEPLFGDTLRKNEDILKLGHFGTISPGPILAVSEAIKFHGRIGGLNKEARLRHLTEAWAKRARAMSHIEMLTPTGSSRSCGIAAFRVKLWDSANVVEYLFRSHKILTVDRKIGNGTGVRIVPHLYTTRDDIDRLVFALEEMKHPRVQRG